MLVQFNAHFAAPVSALNPYDGLESECPYSLVDDFLFVVSASANGTAFNLIMFLVGVEALHMKDMAA